MGNKILSNIKQTWVDNNEQYENDIIVTEPLVNIDEL